MVGLRIQGSMSTSPCSLGHSALATGCGPGGPTSRHWVTGSRLARRPSLGRPTANRDVATGERHDADGGGQKLKVQAMRC